MALISASATFPPSQSLNDAVPIAKVLKVIDLHEFANSYGPSTPEEKKIFQNFKTLLGNPPSPQTVAVLTEWCQGQLQGAQSSSDRFNFVANSLIEVAPLQTAQILSSLLNTDSSYMRNLLGKIGSLYNEEPSFFKKVPLNTTRLKEVIISYRGQSSAQRAAELLQKQSPQELSAFIKEITGKHVTDRQKTDDVICSVYQFVCNADKPIVNAYLRESIEVAPAPFLKVSALLTQLNRKDQAFLAADIERIFIAHRPNIPLETITRIPSSMMPFFDFFAAYGIKDAILLSQVENAFKGGNDILGLAPKILHSSDPTFFCKLVEDEALRRLAGQPSLINIENSELISFIAEHSKNRELLLNIVLGDTVLKRDTKEPDMVGILRTLSTDRADKRIIPLLEQSLERNVSNQLFAAAIENIDEFILNEQYIPSEAVLKKLIAIATSKDENAAQALDGISLLSQNRKIHTTLLKCLKSNAEERQKLFPLLYAIGDKQIVDSLHTEFDKLSDQKKQEVLVSSQFFADKKFIKEAQDIIKNAESLNVLTCAALTYLDSAGVTIDKGKFLELCTKRSLRGGNFDPALIKILAKVGGDEARPIIFSMLDDGALPVRAQAVATLSSMGLVTPKITQRFEEQVALNPHFAAMHLRTAMRLQSTEVIIEMLKNIEGPTSQACRHALDNALTDSKVRKDFFEYLKRRMPVIEAASPQAALAASQLIEHYGTALQLGIHHPLRMPLSLLSSIIEERKSIDKNDTRPRAVIILPRSDHNGAFYFYPQGVESLFKNYKVMVFEVADDRGMQTALQAAAAKAPIDFLSVGGHGAHNMLAFGESDPRLLDVQSGPRVLDLKDEARLGTSLKKIMAKDSLVFLDSCSVGYGENIPGMDNNIANAVRRILGPAPSAIISGTAPIEASSVQYFFNQHGRVQEVRFNVPSYHASITDSPL